MNICVWSGSSFEQAYASYHLMEGIIKAMLEAGHHVWLVQRKRSTGELPQSLQNRERLHVIDIPWKEPKKTAFIKRYCSGVHYYLTCNSAIRKIKHLDAVFLQSNMMAFFPVLLCKTKKLPVLYNVQDIFPQDAAVTGMLSRKHPVYILNRWMQKTAYRMADRVVTISEDLKKTLVEESHRDIDVIYNWSYQNKAYSIADEDNHFLKTYGIKREDGFRVVYAGNVGKMMNAEMLVQTAVLLKDYSDIQIYVIGSGSNIQYITRRSEEENLKNIRFFPQQPMEYAPDNYCMADVNINPVPRGVMFTCMPSKTNTCLLSLKPTVVSMDQESDMARRLSEVDQWTVVGPDDAQAMASAILERYHSRTWEVYSKNAEAFINELGPVENAKAYVRILEDEVKGKQP